MATDAKGFHRTHSYVQKYSAELSQSQIHMPMTRDIDGGVERNIFALYMSLEGPLLSHPQSLLWRGMGSINKCGKQ